MQGFIGSMRIYGKHAAILLVASALLQFTPMHSPAQDARARPRILGIASVHVLAENLDASKAFYSKLLTEDPLCMWCGQGHRNIYSVNENQFVEVSPIVKPYTTSSPAGNSLYEIVLATDDLPALQRYLVAKNVTITTPPVTELDPPTAKNKSDKNATKEPVKQTEQSFINTLDPEGHRIAFVQLPAEAFEKRSDTHSRRIIHAGFVVRDREAEDKFYKDVLGCHVYWHGGMKDGEDDWVDMQVPDGSDWIEYMLGVSADASHKTLGIMNHFAIGVSDIEVAAYAAQKNRISGTEEPKIGRDGKWQLNLYDPDETRVEMMEFTPAEKPCCAEYSGPHPHP